MSQTGTPNCSALISSPVYQVINPATKANLLTSSQSEASKAAASGFTQNQGTPFYASMASATGLVGAHRMFNAKSNDSFWTISSNEIASAVTNYGYVDQGIGFYVSATTASCAQPVYRFVSGAMHRFAVSQTDQAALTAGGWKAEGIMFYGGIPPVANPPAQDAGTTNPPAQDAGVDNSSPPTIPGYTLVFNDEFNGTSIDRNNWEINNGFNYANDELECYTNRAQNAYIENGSLVIQGLKENYQCANALNGSYAAQYTSAKLDTKGKHSFLYGKIQMRAKLPYGKGMWPAFWTLGSNIDQVNWPSCGEIDILELIGGGKNDSIATSNVHYPVNGGSNPVAGSQYSISPQTFANDYHIFAADWDANQIQFSVDGNIYYTVNIKGVTWLHNPQYLLLNLAIGGTWPGNPDATTVFPQKYYIDWVRVYQAQ